MNGLRIGVTVLALVLDALCIALLVAVFFVTRPSASAVLGVCIIGVVVVANLPPLAWSLVQGRRRAGTTDTAGIFE